MKFNLRVNAGGAQGNSCILYKTLRYGDDLIYYDFRDNVHHVMYNAFKKQKIEKRDSWSSSESGSYSPFIEDDHVVDVPTSYNSRGFMHRIRNLFSKFDSSGAMDSNRRKKRFSRFFRHCSCAEIEEIEDVSHFQYQSLTDVTGCIDKITSSIKNKDDYIIKMIEDIMITCRLVSKSSHMVDLTVCLVNFIKLRSTSSLCSSLFSKQALKYVSQLFYNSEQTFEEAVIDLRSFFEHYERFSKTPLFEKIYKVFMYCMTYQLLDRIGIDFDTFKYNKLEQEALKLKFASRTSFFVTVCDTLTFILERGVQCVKTGRLDPLMHSAQSYTAWYDKVLEIKKDSKLIFNAPLHNIDQFKFQVDLRDCIEKGEAIIKYMEKGFERRFLQRELAELHQIKSDLLTKKDAQARRPAPLGILVSGASSQAKSSFTQILLTHYAKKMHLPFDDEYVYFLNPHTDHWDGFNSYKWAIVMDDIADKKPKIAMAGGDPSVNKILQIINETPMMPPMADLPDKGRNPVKCKLAIATTNTLHLNSYHYFSRPIAVLRRFPLIVKLDLKNEYKTNGFLDPTKIPAVPENEYPDLWNIEIVRAQQGFAIDTVDMHHVAEFSNIRDFIIYFNEEIDKHNAMLGSKEAAQKIIDEVSLCELCSLPLSYCDCNQIEGFEFHLANNVELHPLQPQNVDNQNQVNYLVEELTNMSWFSRFKRYIGFENWFKIQLIFVGAASGALCTWFQYVLNFVGFFFLVHFANYLGFFFAMLIYVTPSFVLHLFWFTDALSRWLPWGNRFSNLLSCAMLSYINPNYFIRYLGRRQFQRICGKRNKVLISVCLATVSSIGLVLAFDRYYKRVARQYEESKKEIQEVEHLDAFPQLDAKIICQKPKPDKESQNLEIVCKKPEPKEGEKFNVWVKNDYRLTPFDLTPQITSTKCPLGDFAKILNRNIVRLRFYYIIDGIERMVCSTGALGFCDQYYLINSHALSNIKYNYIRLIDTDNDEKGVSSNFNFRLDSSYIYDIGQPDVSIIKIVQRAPVKNIINLFVKESYRGIHHGGLIIREPTGLLNEHIIKNMRFAMTTSNHGTCLLVRGIVDQPTKDGDCGAPLVTVTPMGTCIMGIHSLGHLDQIGGAIVSFEMLQHFCENKNVLSSGKPELVSQSAKTNLVNLHRKAEVNFIEEVGCANVYGSLDGFRAKQGSEVVPTPFSSEFAGLGYQARYGPPVMKGYEPWRNILKPLVEESPVVSYKEFKDIAYHYCDDVCSRLDPDQLADTLPLDDDTTIFGAEGVTYLDRINMSSSAGNPWKKTKKFLFIEESIEKRGMTPELRERFDDVLKKYCYGERYCPVFCEHLKDEPRSWEKITNVLTRGFSGSPVEWTLVQRKFYLNLVRLIQNNKFEFECAPGLVCQSTEWENLYLYLTEYGLDTIIAGDFAHFDKSMLAILVRCAFKFLIRIRKRQGAPKQELKIMKGIMIDCMFAYTDFNGTLIEFFKGNPSGHALTVIINCLVVNILYRWAYYKLYQGPHVTLSKILSTYRNNVRGMSYGDDNIAGVSRDAPWFNHTAITKKFALIGFTYTMADKHAESVPFIHINDATFLKRRWRFDSDLNHVVAPLEEESIEKMLMVWIPSKTISQENQMAQILDVAVREYFWYGREIFERKRKIMCDVIDKYNLSSYLTNDLPNWESLVQLYQKSSGL